VESQHPASLVPVAESFDLFDLGRVVAPTKPIDDGILERYVSRGLQETLAHVIRTRLHWSNFNSSEIEIREPRHHYNSGPAGQVDYWHQDTASSRMGSRPDFWFILWTSGPSTEITRINSSGYPVGDPWSLPEEHVVVFKNSEYKHRRPVINEDQYRTRWFARLTPDRLRDFNSHMEAYADRARGNAPVYKPAALTYSADAATLDFKTMMETYYDFQKNQYLYRKRPIF
jgi:hypothetical protein